MKRLLFAILLLPACMAAAKAAADQGAWHNQTETSALTDSTSVFWALRGDNEVSNSIGRPEFPSFAVLCKENETRVLFDLQNYMGNDAITMSYRIDGGKVAKKRVDVSVDGRVFGFWNGTGVGFLKQLEGKSRLVIAASPYSKSAVEAVFTIDGVNRMLADVGKTCHW